MSWSFCLILAPTVCYALVCGVYAFKGNLPLAVVYAGYAFANTGLLALDLTQPK